MLAITPGRIVLAGAALVLGCAIVYSATREGHRGAGARDAATEASNPADPFAVLEKQAHDNAGDPAAWRALGAGYFEAARFDDAVRAYEKAAGLAPGLAVVWSALGEARVMASRTDPMPPAAVADFAKAAALDPKDPRARYFLGVKKDLGGDHAGAIADWLALLADTPPGAPWEADLKRTIEQVGKIHRIDVASRLAAVRQPAGQGRPAMGDALPGLPVAAQGIPGPSAADLRAAASIPPGQQRDMAEGMVARLEGKLQADRTNIDGWVMLMRSRMTLGQPDKAAQALQDAVAANPAQATRLRREAGVLGIN